ncbi:DNA-protecting protein DprA [Candidatus Peregrinibacteria bacterium]|jgi:DNA processing protein|nr:DNA-protecting protein DprA [Candidatus Peregrinibacteria bacterium]MBT4632342.1 DNA-protecting protein DprA [Candidatus Peregrinibacteria bacterium]MBT5517124.1 DNA-protecting protein DprA [Candidatus Peregrinibacteria bacterium]MBT5824034.1 DNA-protecting protein DprA [Candidatus Peregrinibacteria bacterium]
MKVSALPISDPRYPALLREIYDPPAQLFYVGNLDVLERQCIAIVGTRRCSSYGESKAYSFAKDLSRHGVCVVSGLAYGIDAAAHKGALEGSGSTIAVLAQGLPEIMPRRNVWLAKKIVEKGGLLLCEKEAGSETFKSSYLERNRLISGLCKGTLLIEAPWRSGALNTAKHALNQNREVMAIPGRIGDEMSSGTNKLLQGGARLIMGSDELIEALGLRYESLAIEGLTGLQLELVNLLKKNALTGSELGELFAGDLKNLYSALGALELNGIVKLTNEMRYAVCSGGRGG